MLRLFLAQVWLPIVSQLESIAIVGAGVSLSETEYSKEPLVALRLYVVPLTPELIVRVVPELGLRQ